MLSDPIIDCLTFGMVWLRVCGMLAVLLVVASIAPTVHLLGSQAPGGAQP